MRNNRNRSPTLYRSAPASGKAVARVGEIGIAESFPPARPNKFSGFVFVLTLPVIRRNTGGGQARPQVTSSDIRNWQLMSHPGGSSLGMTLPLNEARARVYNERRSPPKRKEVV